jgi:heme/copper-type cytochrome/quinol oxidase subunit 4
MNDQDYQSLVQQVQPLFQLLVFLRHLTERQERPCQSLRFVFLQP